MSQATTVRKPRKSRTPGCFRCELVCGSDRYTVCPLAGVHPEVARKAYRVHKLTGSQEVYDVRLTIEGHAECDCPGFTRWGHCKHVRMLAALGCLPVTSGPP